jgi:hypothetical protein
MNTRRMFLFSLFSLLIGVKLSAQGAPTLPVNYSVGAPNYFFTVDKAPDPALAHNKLLMEKSGDGVLTQIGTFKVKGNPNLFSGRNKGDMFTREAKAYNIAISYNTYNQEVGFHSTSNPTQMLVKEPGEVDSFILHADPAADIPTELKFIYGELLGSKDKAYYQVVYEGPNYSVYKKYKSELGIVSENYIQSDLRRFDLLVDYYYSGGGKKLKKIRPNSAVLIKEFKDVKDLSKYINDDIFVANAEQALRKTFQYLNN